MDYAKAFDSLEHWLLYQGLADANVNKKYIRIVKFIYDNATAKIKIDKLSRSFKIETESDKAVAVQLTSLLILLKKFIARSTSIIMVST